MLPGVGGLLVVVLLSIGRPTDGRIVWIPGPLAPGLAQRLDGQLSDLSWTIERGPSSAGPFDAPDRADAIVWFARSPRGGLTVRLGLPDRRRWRRDIVDLSPAATYEAAALVLRSALLAIEEGAAPAWPDEPTPPPPPGWGWSIAARTELNGIATTPGLQANAFRRWSALSLGLQAAGRLPYTVDADAAELRVERYDLTLVGGLDTRLDAWAIGGRFAAGAAVWRRRTVRGSETTEAAGASMLVSPLTTFGVRVGRRVANGWSLDLGLGADILWQAPQWTVDDGTVVDRPWGIQPWITLGLTADPIFDGRR